MTLSMRQISAIRFGIYLERIYAEAIRNDQEPSVRVALRTQLQYEPPVAYKAFERRLRRENDPEIQEYVRQKDRSDLLLMAI